MKRTVRRFWKQMLAVCMVLVAAASIATTMGETAASATYAGRTYSQNECDRIYANAKASALAEKKAFTQAATQQEAVNAKKNYRTAMETLEILCGQSEKTKKQFQAECKKLPRSMGKTLEEIYGNLQAYTNGNEAIQAKISGNRLTLDVYVNFKGAYNTQLDGESYAALAQKGFRLWQGSYAGNKHDFGANMFFTVKMNIREIFNGAGARDGQNYFEFVCFNSIGRSATNYGIGFYDRHFLGTQEGLIYDRTYTNGAIRMYAGLKNRYSASLYTKVAAHEFGHVLGLGDLYGKNAPATSECPVGTFYVDGDIMGTHGKVTANNIEMMLEAYRTGWYQAYVTVGYEKKSNVIRSY